MDLQADGAGPLFDQKVISNSSINIGKHCPSFLMAKLSDPKEFLPRTRKVSSVQSETTWW